MQRSGDVLLGFSAEDANTLVLQTVRGGTALAVESA